MPIIWATILRSINDQAFWLASQVARTVVSLMKRWKTGEDKKGWKKARLVVEPVGQEEVGSNFCYLSGSAIRTEGRAAGLNIDDWNFGPNPDTSIVELQNGLK